MKKLVLPAMLLLTSICTFAKTKEKDKVMNPLLTNWSTPYQTPPFELFKPDHFVPAFKDIIERSKKQVDKIVASKDEPTFENTVVALERGGEELEKVANVFFNLNSAETSPELQAVAREVAPMLSDFSNDINLNAGLFAKVKKVYDNRNRFKLTPEQRMLLEKTFKGFVRSGANLDPKSKERYREITKQLSELSLQFEENLLAETNGFVLNITNEADLAGIPESIREMAKSIAQSKNMGGWAFDLSMPSFVSFMKYAENRDLREKLFRAYNMRGFQKNKYDNQEILIKTANLRLEEAKLLGYKTYADFVLEERMAQSPAKVNGLLTQLLNASVPASKKEVEEVAAFAKESGANFEIQRWDWAFYSEKLKDKKYSVNDELIRPYFPLEKVREGVFALVNKLYGITFKSNASIPVYNKDVEAYEVFDKDGKFLSVLFMDYFPRASKSGGAWMTNYRSQFKENGKDVRPVVSLVFNFTKPTETRPALLNFNELETFLHEFGHGLHGMFANSTYSSLSGTNVYRDFVELPSQIMENWAVEKEFLDMFAGHYQTGEKIPQELVNKIKESANFQAGYVSLRQLSFGLLDMAWHSQASAYNGSVVDFERAATKATDILPAVDGTAISPAFAHIFSGGYAAGYYGYKWAEVLDADAYSLFKKKGIFDAKTAQSFRENILSKGGTEHPMTLYIKFRGQEPSIDALLERSGLKN